MRKDINVRVSWPVFWAAVQLLAAIVLFTGASLAYRWPGNLLPGFYLMTSTVCYGLVMWADGRER